MTPWTVAHQAPLSMAFSRQEWVAISSSRRSSLPRNQTYVSHLLHWQAGSLPLVPSGKPNLWWLLASGQAFPKCLEGTHRSLTTITENSISFILCSSCKDDVLGPPKCCLPQMVDSLACSSHTVPRVVRILQKSLLA